MKTFSILILFSCLALTVKSQQVEWAFGIGGTNVEYIEVVEVDSSGNTYIAGQFGSENLDFDSEAGELLASALGGYDIYFAKYDPTGSLLWAKTLQGVEFSVATDLAIDDNGGIFITGTFNGTVNFNPDGLQELTAGSSGNGFVVHFNSDGTFDYVFSISGEGNSSGYAIELDQDGNIYLAGDLSDAADFDPSTESVNLLLDPAGFYLAKYTSEGDYLWAWGIPANGGAQLKDMDVTPDGDVVVTGFFQQEMDLDPGDGINLYTSDDIDSFVLKVNTTGEAEWGLVISGDGNQIALGAELDQSGDVYIAGQFTSEIDLDPTSGTEIVPSSSSASAFVTKLSSDGAYLWGETVMNVGDARFFAVDEEPVTNSIYLTGFANGTITLPDESVIFSSGGADILAVQLNSDGNFMNHLIFGGITNEAIKTGGVAVYNETLTIGGSYLNTIDFGPGDDVLQGPASQGMEDVFLARYAFGTSVDEAELLKASFYPNPTSHSITLTEIDVWDELIIHDLLGRPVLTCDYIVTNEIDVQGLSSGTYIVSVVLNEEVILNTHLVKR